MVLNWGVKELIASVKLNNLSVRRASVAEQATILDSQRVAGDSFYNTDNKTFQMYQTGSGATYNVTELSNFLWRQKVQIAIGSSKTTIYNEPFINMQGKMNTAVFVIVEYLALPNLTGEIEATVTDGITPVNNTVALSSNPAPTAVKTILSVATTSFAINAVLNVKLSLTNCEVQYVEFRSI